MRNRNSALIRHSLLLHYIRTVTSVQRETVKIMKIDRSKPLLWIVAAAAMTIGFFQVLPLPFFVGKNQDIQVLTEHHASEHAILTGRSTATNQLTPGETINLNTATQKELEGLKGIGAKKAQAIIAYRKKHGKFETTAELVQVEGMGDATLSTIRPYITVE